MSGSKPVGVLYTGGTIGSVDTPLRPLSQDEFRQAFNTNLVPVLKGKGVSAGSIPWQGPTLDSTNLQPSNWVTIAHLIVTNYNKYSGFVVLHGTDTMAFTASALSFLLTGLDKSGYPNAMLDKPVIVTGSQLPLFYQSTDDKKEEAMTTTTTTTTPNSTTTTTTTGDCQGKDNTTLLYNTDAFQNVCGALQHAQQSGITEVCVYFRGRLFRGNRTIKESADNFRAFGSPMMSPLAVDGVDGTENNNLAVPLTVNPDIALSTPGVMDVLVKQLGTIKAGINEAKVAPFLAFPAPYSAEHQVLGSILKATMDTGLDGVVLESYGEGNFPSGAAEEVLMNRPKNIVLVNCTQVINGTVNSTAYQAGAWLKQVRAHDGFDMTPIAAYCKLVYLTTLKGCYEWSPADIGRLMQTNLVGEVMDMNRLDSFGRGYLAPSEQLMSFNGSFVFRNCPDKGPLLMHRNSDGSESFLWGPKGENWAPGMTRLVMGCDGILVLYDRAGVELWRAGSEPMATQGGRFMLRLESSMEDQVQLRVYDYVHHRYTTNLYPPAQQARL